MTTKTRIYQAFMLSVLLYAVETWTLLDADSKALEANEKAPVHLK